MSRTYTQETHDTDRFAHVWRMFVVAGAALVLCSCRGPLHRPAPPCPAGPGSVVESCPVPTAAMSGAPMGMLGGSAPELIGGPCPAGSPCGVPAVTGEALPYNAYAPWSPPGLGCPWPKDEYLCDGGDRGMRAGIGERREVLGLEPEDAIAHYDTPDGRTHVEPSNRVCMYAPRFGAVRKVVGLVAEHQWNRAGDVNQPEVLVSPTTTTLVADSRQNIPAVGQVGVAPPIIYRGEQFGAAVSEALRLQGFQDALLAYENLELIRTGTLEGLDMPLLARGSTAAVAWSREQMVQVVLDKQAAMAMAQDEKVETVFTYKSPDGAKLRLTKLASTPFAEPGDEVAFTLRFDNTGVETIDNVVILDNLTTRLEYVPGSAQCSRDAKFSTEPSESLSLVVRCELEAPLKPGEGGVLRFRCRVR